jgi:hypothetical protein
MLTVVSTARITGFALENESDALSGSVRLFRMKRSAVFPSL